MKVKIYLSIAAASLVSLPAYCQSKESEPNKSVTTFSFSQTGHVLEVPTSDAGHYLEILPMPSGMWLGTRDQKEAGYDYVTPSHYVDQSDLIKETADFVAKSRGDSLPLIIKLSNKEIWRSPGALEKKQIIGKEESK